MSDPKHDWPKSLAEAAGVVVLMMVLNHVSAALGWPSTDADPVTSAVAFIALVTALEAKRAAGRAAKQGEFNGQPE